MFKFWRSKKSLQPVKEKNNFFERLANRIMREEQLAEAARYVAKALGEEVAYHDFRYEHGDFAIDFTYEDRPKLYYTGICVLHHVYKRGSGLDRVIYHADETWESQLLALKEDAERQIRQRDEEAAALREDEHRINHLPLKDFLQL